MASPLRETDAVRDGNPRGRVEDQITLLVTPTSQLAVNGGSQHPDKRKAGGHGPTLADQIEQGLLPTPRATDGTKGGPNQRGSSGDLMLPSAVHQLLPTPEAADSSGGRVSSEVGGVRPSGSKRAVTLATAVQHALLPTPTAQDGANTGGASQYDRNSLPLNALVNLLPTPNGFHLENTETPEEWLARRADVQERTGTRHGPALPVVALSVHDGHPLIQQGDGPELVDPGDDQWGPYATAVHRWEAITREAPAPVEQGPKGGTRLAPKFVEWMMGQDEGHVTDVPGVSRNEQLRALGNGVVRQQAVEAFRWLLAQG